MSGITPKWANWLLRKCCKPDLLEAIEGDLREFYARQPPGLRRKLQYWFQVLHLLRPQLLRAFPPLSGQWIMLLRFDLLFTWRYLKRHRFFSLLNVMGLAVGLCSSLLIGLYVLDEWSFDRHWKDREQIYRVYVDIDFGTTQAKYANATAPMANIFENDFADVLVAARWINSPDLTFRHKDALTLQKQIIYADQSFFEVFSLEPVYGSTVGALSEPNTMVLTQSTSRKFFGDKNPVGQILKTNEGEVFKISCVVRDIPRNSHFEASMIRTTINDQWSDPSKVPLLAYWTASVYRTYLKLRPGTDPRLLEQQFEAIYPRYFNPVTQAFSGQTWEEFKAEGNKYDYRLQPLVEVYLHSDFQNDGLAQGNIRHLTLFGLIGLLILGMAYINFVNLTIASSSHRQKELAMKKIIGSSRLQLGRQFMLESLTISLLAAGLAALLSYLVFPVFNEVTGKEILDPLMNEHGMWFYLLMTALLAGMLVGCYPALVLSKVQSISALKGKGLSLRKNWFLRHSLVAFQYTIVVFLMVGTTVVYHQLRFLQTEELGYDMENLLVINNAEAVGQRLEEFRNALMQFPEIISVSAPRHVPGDLFFFGGMMYESNRNTQDGRINCKRLWVDSELIPTMGLEIQQGRNFDMVTGRDSMAVIITASAVASLGLGPDPLGKSISFTDGKDESFKVIGVINDFHVRSLKSRLFAVALHQVASPTRLAVRYHTNDLAGLVGKLEATWSTLIEDHIMSFQFGTERYTRFYTLEQQMKRVFDVFVVIAIFIASLGLIGLAVVHTLRRQKEMGVRRVL